MKKIEQAQQVRLTNTENGYKTVDGFVFPFIEASYQTWGALNESKDNVILLCHALSGSQNAKGYNPVLLEADDLWQPELHEGWWGNFIGSNKAIDTDNFFVICVNYLGGCYGTTGPSSINPKIKKPYGKSFPNVQVEDQSIMMDKVLTKLGIDKIHSVVGPSVGGLIALNYAHLFPEKVRNIISIASGCKTTVLTKLILFEQILAIENDSHFNGGDYYEGIYPDYGLALARMISHKTFVHLNAIEQRAKSDVIQDCNTLDWYKIRDPFQSYMLHQGKKFIKRFDANTYLRIVDMWSRFDPISDCSNYFKPSKEHRHRYLVFSIDSDFCFYPEEQAQIVEHLEKHQIDCTYITVHSDKGHDAFLLEPHLFTPHMKQMLS